MRLTIERIPGAEAFQIALIILPLCIVCVVGAAWAAPFPTAPIQKPAVAKLHKDHSRIAISAVHERSSLPWSCETIRAAVGKLSRQQLDRLARVHRLTDQQKAEAMACLKEKKT